MNELTCGLCHIAFRATHPFKDGQGGYACPECVTIHHGPAMGRSARADAPWITVPADLLLRLADAAVGYAQRFVPVGPCEEREDVRFAFELVEAQEPEYLRSELAMGVRPFGPTSAVTIATTEPTMAPQEPSDDEEQTDE